MNENGIIYANPDPLDEGPRGIHRLRRRRKAPVLFAVIAALVLIFTCIARRK